MRKALGIILVLGLLIFSIGCSSDETMQPAEPKDDATNMEEKNDPQPAQEQQKSDNKEEEKEVYTGPVAPLTGLPVEEEVTGRIVGIMVNNHQKARPQTGLGEADIVYEILAEGRITRFVAIYHSQMPEVIGPVRSIRPYYIETINGFDALIVHAGSSPTAFAMLRQNSLPDLDEIENAGGAFWRESFRNPPHNLYTSMDKIKSVAAAKGYRDEGYIPEFIFLNEEDEKIGTKAENIEIVYDDVRYKVEYKYDKEAKLYKRFVNENPHSDLETKEQLTAKNILIVEAYHKVLDSEGRRKIDIYGPGKGYLIQQGKSQEVTWERKDGVIRAFIDGKEQGLYPGQTWVMVVPHMTDVHIE